MTTTTQTISRKSNRTTIRNRKPAVELRTPAQIEAELARIDAEVQAHIAAEIARAAEAEGASRRRSEQAAIADVEVDPEYEAWKKANGLTGRLSRKAYVEEFAIY